MSTPAASFFIRPGTAADAVGFLQLVKALADFEKLPPPDEAACGRLVKDAFGDRRRIEVWLAFAEGGEPPVGYAIFLETYSSFLALPTLYIEDIFVLENQRGRGIGGALLKQAVRLAKERGCGRVEWTALDWNINAQRVYEDKMGARRLSEWFLYRMTQTEIDTYLEGTRRSTSS